jgi:hypothetical protein
VVAIANRFWVGNTGNWSDTAHWSATTGGVGGASVPTSVDNVYFDANSFTLTGQTVTVNTTANCLDMDWTGALNIPTLTGGFDINIYGNLVFISGMSDQLTGDLNLSATTTGKTITTNGVVIKGRIRTFGAGGYYTLQDNLTTTSDVANLNGTLDTNSKAISCKNFVSNGTNTRALTLGASIITCSGSVTITSTGLTLTANTSTIKMTGNTITFAGSGLTYNNVEFQGTPTTVTGANTFNTLTIAAGKTVNLTSATTHTITSLVCNGTTASPSTLQSVTAGSAATIALPAGRYFIRHTSIKDIAVTGATAVTSIAGTNVSGNTGITFVTKFEMGRIKNDGSFNWYNTSTGTVTKVSG